MINDLILAGAISWYASGGYKDGTLYTGDTMTTACWREYRSKTFKVSYKGKSIKVLCNDTGNFKKNGQGFGFIQIGI